jgi:hypothetical protein
MVSTTMATAMTTTMAATIAAVIVVRVIVASLVVTGSKDRQLVKLGIKGVNPTLKFLHNPPNNPISAIHISLTQRGMHMLHHTRLGLPILNRKGAHLESMQHGMFRAQGIRECASKNGTPFLSREVLQRCTHGSCFGIDATDLQL